MELNLAPRAYVPARCRIMLLNINGLHGNLNELAVAASHFDIVFCCDTKATRRRQAAELRLPGYCAPDLLSKGSRPNGLGMVMYSSSGLAVSPSSIFECGCC